MISYYIYKYISNISLPRLNLRLYLEVNAVSTLALSCSINNELIYMHSYIHNGRFINHLWLIVEANGAAYEACVRAQTIKRLSYIMEKKNCT